MINNSINLLVFLFFLLFSGFLKISVAKKSLERDFGITETYFNNLKKYLSSQGKDNQTYSWLIFRSDSMQRMLGGYGILAFYQPPGRTIQYRNIQLIINLLPELKKSYQDQFLLHNLGNDYADILQEALIRYLGALEEAINLKEREIKNPFKALRDGCRLLISIPILILNWTGIISEGFSSRLINSAFFNLLSGVFSLISLVGSIIGIATGWESFTSLLRNFLTAL